MPTYLGWLIIVLCIGCGVLVVIEARAQKKYRDELEEQYHNWRRELDAMDKRREG